ncbi:trypsin-7-like [Ochlerotatus camptorhynchus]|uniref:trypsin-7-like n=1 Tax=Ochlerotatus camptorhynchus TaxID=644619 RepID=UPI0031D1529C
MFTTVITVVAVAICLTQTHADQHSSLRIVNGTAVDIRNHPHQVAIVSRPGTEDESDIAGGTLIGEHWVLSAAHLFKSTRASWFGVRVGASSMAEGGTVIEISGLSYHPNYNPKNMDCDFVLLRLREPYTIDSVGRAIPMVQSGEEVADGTTCTASGWGTTMGTGSNETLRAVQVPIVNHEVCRKNYAASRLNVTENMLCAGYDDGMRDSCTGDSGGPLVCDGKLVGVISWGRKCAQKNYYGVYAKVANARNWIEQKTGI